MLYAVGIFIKVLSVTDIAGRRFRLLTVIDDYNRQSLASEIDSSLPALRVIRTLKQLIERRTKPQVIRVDNGPEFISDRLQQWCDDNQIRLQFIQPGKPMQNGFIERNNGSLRKELNSTQRICFL